MKVKIVLNPYANRWAAKAQVPQIEAAFRAAGIAYDLTVTAEVGEGIPVTEEAVRAGYDAIVAAGGDGTINEVVNGLIRAAAPGNPTLPLGILPLGTANDFSDMAGLPRDLKTAVQTIRDRHTWLIDAGRVNDYYFINNSAVAMEPMVTLENIKMKRFSGELRYIVALVRALVKLSAWQMEIAWDGGGYEGPGYLLSLCNTPRTGGFYMAPEAVMDDGLLDFVFAPEVPKRTVLAVLLRLLRGTHVYHPVVTYGRTTRLSLTSQPGTPLHADGEIIAEAVTVIDYQVLPDQVNLIVPHPA